MRFGVVVLVALGVAVYVRALDRPAACRTKAPEDGAGVTHVNLGARVWHVAAGPKGLWAIRQPDVTRQSSQLVELDPSSGKIKGEPIELPAVGFALDVGKDFVWVVTSRITAHPVGILHKVDLRTRRIVASFRVGRGTSSVAEGEGGVWVANPGNNNVLRVDVVRRRILARTRIEGGPDLVLARDKAVWVGTQYGNTAVYRIDPKTGKVLGSVEGTLANAGAGGVWVIRNAPPNGRVFRIDKASFPRLGRSIGLEILPASVGIAGGDVWVGQYFQYCIDNSRGRGGTPPISMGWIRVDPTTLKPLSGPVHVGHNPRPPVFAGGSFWIVPDDTSNELIRIDLAAAAKVRPAGHR